VSNKRGLPAGVGLRHDAHYVEEISKITRSVGRVIQADKIEPNPAQPRSEIGDLSELTNSVKEKGILEPILVKPTGIDSWMIIAGERRWRAANLAGLTEIPCIELDIDEKGIAEIALIENMQRKDLTVWEESDGLAALSARFGYTHEEIAKKIGKSRTTVTESLAIAGLPPEVREKCRSNKIHAKSTLLEISRQFDQDSMLDLLSRIQTNGLVTREKIRREIRPPQEIKQETKPGQKTNPVEKPPVIIKSEPKVEMPAVSIFRLDKPPVTDFVAADSLSGSNTDTAVRELEAERAKNELVRLVNSPLPNASTRLSTESHQSSFIYVPTSHDFKIEIKFQKKDKYNLDDVIDALRKTLDYWEQTR
jgi:ParB family transcriptional regulator, chromosome partitioning protein